jgi:hypothetical protein
LEILDPHAGVPVKPCDLDPVMVRRLKSDLRYFGETFPERNVEPIYISRLRSDAPELVLSGMLTTFGRLSARTANLPPCGTIFALCAVCVAIFCTRTAVLPIAACCAMFGSRL